MFSLQEIISKFEANLREVRRSMDDTATFHPSSASVYKGLNPAEQQGIRETLRSISIQQLCEFLGRGSTIGDYLVADKVHDDLVFYATETDLAPLISAQVVTGWQGADLIVNVVDDESYKPNYTIGGATAPSSTVNTTKCTLTPKTFTLNISIAQDLEEDTNFALTDYHVKLAAKAVGHLSTKMALEVLISPPDGVGTVNSSATGDADETKLTNGTTADVVDAVRANGNDKFKSNTLVTTPEAWGHSISTQATEVGWSQMPATAGFHTKLGILDVALSSDEGLHASTDVPEAAFTNCISVIFDRNAALLTGRKRWMQIENYAQPVSDLGGAVVSCRQDSISLYKDAIYVLTET